MGLAGTRNKQKFGLDPRNTQWSNDTSRFGHQHLVKMGWNPGNGLGKVKHAITSHIKVNIKRDNVGLGANLARNRDENGNVLDAADNAYLDEFQKVLGRLNGKEQETSEAIEKRRKDRIISGKWGMDFVLGDTLRSTWDTEKRGLKRDLDNSDEDHELDGPSEKKLKGSKTVEKTKKKHKHKKSKKSKDKSSEDKPHHHHHRHHHKHHKHHKHHHQNKETAKDRKADLLTPVPEDESEQQPQVIGSRMALRSKWIKQKRAAVMDAKALQEIFMVR